MAEREVFILMEDVDGTMWSGPEPIGFAVTSKEQAREFVEQTKGFASYRSAIVVDTVDEVRGIRRRRSEEREAHYAKLNAESKIKERNEFHVAFRGNKNRPIPEPEFSDEEKELLGPLAEGYTDE